MPNETLITYDEYAEALNAHAEKCEQCRTSRKIGTVLGVCEDGMKIVQRWRTTIAAVLAGKAEKPDAD